MGLIATVRRELGETSAVFWSDQQIIDALNEAQVCVLADYPRVLETSTTLVLTTASATMAVPAGIFIPKMILDDAGQQVPFSSQVDLENFSSTWKATSPGKPERFVLWQWDKLIPWPTPDANYTYSIFGNAYPVELTTATDTSALNDDLQRAIAFYAAAILFLPTRVDLTQLYYKEYTETMEAFTVKMRRTLAHNTRRLRPGGALTNKQRGSLQAKRYY